MSTGDAASVIRVAVYTLTRDRLEFSRECLSRLWSSGFVDSNVEPIYFVLDNGSEDETVDWLHSEDLDLDEDLELVCLKENVGISLGESRCLHEIRKRERSYGFEFDAFVKFDNDCYVRTEGAVGKAVEVAVALREVASYWILSPRVEGLVNPPRRTGEVNLLQTRIGVVGHVGGLCRIAPRPLIIGYQPQEDLPKAWGQDEDFAAHARALGARQGYVEDVVVEHYLGTEGQAKRFPEYFERKFEEEGARDVRKIRRQR